MRCVACGNQDEMRHLHQKAVDNVYMRGYPVSTASTFAKSPPRIAMKKTRIRTDKNYRRSLIRVVLNPWCALVLSLKHKNRAGSGLRS
jgi:hypothetical protein